MTWSVTPAAHHQATWASGWRSFVLPDVYVFDPGDQFPMEVRLECLNSVDGTTRFRAEMGWFRLVCSNGLAIGVTRSESNLRHVGDLRHGNSQKIRSVEDQKGLESGF